MVHSDSMISVYSFNHSTLQSNSFDLSWSAYSDALKILFMKVETLYLDQMFPKLCRIRGYSLKTKRQW